MLTARSRLTITLASLSILVLPINLANGQGFLNVQSASTSKPQIARAANTLYIKMPSSTTGNYFKLTLFTNKNKVFGSVITVKPGKTAIIKLNKSGVVATIASITWGTYNSKNKKLKSQSSAISALSTFKLPTVSASPSASATVTPSASSSPTGKPTPSPTPI